MDKKGKALEKEMEQIMENFDAKDLTVEERLFLKRARTEGTKKSLPYAVLCGSLVYYGFRKFSLPVRVFTTVAAGSTGLAYGSALYFYKNFINKAIAELPPESVLRRSAEKGKELYQEAASNTNNKRLNFPVKTDSQYNKNNNMLNENFPLATTPSEETKTLQYEEPENTGNKSNNYVSYNDLRKRHRQNEAKTWAENNFNLENRATLTKENSELKQSNTESEMEIPNMPIKYNKFGDPIFEETS